MKQAIDLTEVNEQAVVALAKTGNHSAFAELVIRHQSWLRNFLRRLSSNPVLADDLTQQVFLLAWKGIKQLESNNAFGGWLKRLAVNTWLQHIRRNDPLSLVDSNTEDDIEVLVSRKSESVGKGIDLDHALAALQPQVRLCVVLSYNEGMSHAMIEEITQLPLGTVKSHIKRGAQKLRQLLAAYKETST